MKDIKRWLPGALISIVVVAAILYFVDFKIMLNAIRGANYGILAIAMALSFVWMFGRAKVWQTLLRDKASYQNVLFSVGEGYILNNFLPFRLGELGRAFLLSRKSTLQFGEIIPTIFIERFTDIAISAIIFLSALPFVASAEMPVSAGYVLGGAMLLGLGFLYILARNNQWARDLFYKLSGWWPSIQKLGGSFLESFFTGLSVLTDGWLFLRFLFWMLLDWAVAVFAYYLMIRAFFPQAEWLWAFLGIGAAALGGAIPSLPGGLGTFEGAIVFALSLFVKDESTALAAALTMRFYNYLNSTVIGGIGLLREGQTLSGVYQQILNFRKKDNEP